MGLAVHYGLPGTLRGMTENDLTPEQAEILFKQVGERLRYFATLRERMERTHWEPNDRLYVLVKEIFDKLHPLNGRCHYLRMSHGVSRPPRRE